MEQLFGLVLKKGLKNPKTDAIECIKCTDARGVTERKMHTVQFLLLRHRLRQVIRHAVWQKDVPSIEPSIIKAKDSVKFYALDVDLKVLIRQ